MKGKKLAFLISIFLGCSYFFYGQEVPKMRNEDKIRIKEAITISQRFGDKIWKGINEVPFVVLLVVDNIEFLINHPYPSNDFKLSENDEVLKTKIFYRQRTFPESYLATFPAVNGINCIVVGIPEKTNKNSTNWIITLLHEHFHQYQFTSKYYYEEVKKLNLSGGDETGMWQLNYPFPYNNPKVINQFNKYTSALFKAVSNVEEKNFNIDFKNYLKQRIKFKNLLNISDYRYFSFQIWQEGIARYTEYKFLQTITDYIPSKEMAQLKDFVNFKDIKNKFYLTELKSLSTSKLEINKRVSFYAIGLAEGILLDKQNPNWQKKYDTEKFYVENYFNEN